MRWRSANQVRIARVEPHPDSTSISTLRAHFEHVPVRVDGADVPGMRPDTGPNVFGVGVAVGDRILTAVIARDYPADSTVAFETLSPRPRGV